MGHLHLIHPPPRQLLPDEGCLAAFQKDLDYVYQSLRRLGAPAAEWDDLAQEVFLALRRNWAEFDTQRPVRPYLFGIAFRLVSASHRKRRREVSFGIVETDDTAPNPDEALQTKQARALVLAALARIPLERRAVLVMHDIDDVPVRDVAASLSIPLFTVYSRLRKARRELESALRRLAKPEGGA